MAQMIRLTLETGAVFDVLETSRNLGKDDKDWSGARKGSWIDRNGVFHEGLRRKTGKIDALKYHQ